MQKEICQMIEIRFLDPVYSECSDIHRVKECLKYDSVYWKPGPFKKTRVSQQAYLCTHRKGIDKGLFLTGLAPRIMDYCRRNDIPVSIDPPLEFPPFQEPTLPGISLRSDQTKLIDDVKKNKRGIIVSPTGSGKTVLAGALISMLPRSRAVFVVHTKSLFRQTVEEFSGWFGRIGVIGDEEFHPDKINVVMAQTARSILAGDDKWLIDQLADVLGDADILIIDEAHHLGNEEGHYSGIMKNCLAPIRVGFTATPLKSSKPGLVCEGYLGPEIGRFGMDEGIEKGIIAKPRVKLIPVPINVSIAEKRRYKDLYVVGIILNKQRNRLIAKEVADQTKAGKSVLVMIQDVEHGQGEQIMEIAKEVYGIDMKFVQGSTEGDIREKIKKELESKETMAVISTSVWREGINIRSLNTVINGCGGKAEIMTLQAIGRGLRTTEDKKSLLIVDFLDPYQYLAQHTIQRLKIYVDNGWL